MILPSKSVFGSRWYQSAGSVALLVPWLKVPEEFNVFHRACVQICPGFLHCVGRAAEKMADPGSMEPARPRGEKERWEAEGND